MNLPELALDLLLLAGAASIAVGTGLIFLPAGLIAAGVLVIGLVLLYARDPEPDE